MRNGSAEQLAAAADVLITLLPGTKELRDAMAIAVPALRPGSTWIDMTSAAPGIDAELGAQAHARGVESLDAPLGGDPPQARDGALQLFVGGSAETVRRHRHLLELLGQIEHLGDHGAGHTSKLLVNLLWFGQAVATGEALLLARRAGIDLDTLRAALARSSAATEFIRGDLDAVFAGDYMASFGLDRCCEELRAVVDLANELEVPFELSRNAATAYDRALERYGATDGELLAVRLLEDEAGSG